MIYSIFTNSRADNSRPTGPITLIIELIQGIMVMKLLYKFQIDRKRNELARVPTWNCFGRTDGTTDGVERLLDLLLPMAMQVKIFFLDAYNYQGHCKTQTFLAFTNKPEMAL